MSIICPTVLAKNYSDFSLQLQKINFADRIQIDVMDGVFADSKSIELAEIPNLPAKQVDIHAMYKNPDRFLNEFVRIKPSMIIVHAETSCDIPQLATDLREHNIKTGLAILQKTKIEDISYLFPHIQHLLIFAGNLGHYGGRADLSLLSKIKEAKQHAQHLEYGWDGGANLSNIVELQQGGVDIINVGSSLQHTDNSWQVFQEMTNILITSKSE